MPRLKELKVFDGDTRYGGYVIVDVIYRESVSRGWIFNGAIPGGLRLMEEEDAEDGDEVEYADCGAVAHRKWAGPMTHEAIQAFRRDWQLDHGDSESNLGMLTEYGALPGDRYQLDGMAWNQGGGTPILDVSVSVFDAIAVANQF